MKQATVGLRFAIPLRPTVSTRSIEEAEWLLVDDSRRLLLDHKRRLIADRPAQVLAVDAVPQPIGTEVAESILDHYARHHPGLLLRSGQKVVDADSGATLDLTRQHPMAVVSQVVAEDLCVMVPEEGVWILQGACVCFPSRWNLAEKVGRSLDDIHDVVPGYSGGVAEASRGVFDRLEDRILLRFNWTVLDDPTLFQPHPPAERSRRALSPEDLYLRVERQTLRRLPTSGAVLFAIHTTVQPLAEVGDRPEQARDLAASLRSSTSATREYKGWEGLVDRAAGFLEERAAAGTSRL